MRSVVVAGSLLAAVLLLAPVPAAAQEEKPAKVKAPEVRMPDSGGPRNRVPATAIERPVREEAMPAAGHPAAAEDQRGGGRRGAVRRPPSGGSPAPDDRAIPRAAAPPRPRTTVINNYPYRYYPYYSPYFDPWGYGSFGLGSFYYSPWAWAPYGYGYPYYPRYGGSFSFDVGNVKLKVKPRDAEVWVDGYYAGAVDDFDGVFQSLKLESGAYRIEVRKPGYETLTYDVRVQPERTITFRGEMKPLP